MKRARTNGALAVAALALGGLVRAEAAEVPAGTRLAIRLTTRVSSRASQPGDAVDAVLVAPVEVEGRAVLPAGSTLRGTVRAVEKRQGRASLRLDFTELLDATLQASPVATRVVAVDNARESVDPEGRILGPRPMRRLPSPFTAFALLAADADPPIIAAIELGRLVIRAVRRGAIDYPPGVELTLALDAPLETAADPEVASRAAADPALSALARTFPCRAQARRHVDADVTNLLLVGSREEVGEAFLEAGWTRARPMGVGDGVRGLWALLTQHPDKGAAVSRLELAGRPPDLVFEKQNDTLAKRHHVRLWKEEAAPGGDEVWAGAATHDVGIAFDRRRRAFTHRIDPQVDGEREKIVDDLELTGEVAAFSLVDRPMASPSQGRRPGEAIETDGRVAVVVLRPPPAVADDPP